MSSTSSPRTIVMTGGTNGIGASALARLAAAPHTRVILGARGAGRAAPAGVEVLPLDLTSLDSVRAFADDVIAHLDGAPIDALVLNAGTQTSDLTQRTKDGFELTFGVNHLAHYLLARLLEPSIASGGRLILTTSDTHDPAITPLGPKSFDTTSLAHPVADGFGSGMRAYTSSKLANLLSVQAFAHSPELAARDVKSIAFNPGFTVGTNLGGRSPRAQRIFGAIVVPIFSIVSRFKPEYSAGKPERASEVLADVALGAITPPAGKVYVSIVAGDVTYPTPAALARDESTRTKMWDESADLVGLPRNG